MSASLSMATAIADDNNMGGLYIGLGANIGYDEYDARANVGYENAIKSVTVDKAINGVTLENCDSANNLVTKLWECGKTGEPQDITYKDETDNTDEVTIVSSKDMDCKVKVHIYDGAYNPNTCKQDNDVLVTLTAVVNTPDYIVMTNAFTETFDFSSSQYPHFHKSDNSDIALDAESYTDYYYKAKNYTLSNLPQEVQLYKDTGEPISKSIITPDKATYLMSQSLHRSGHNAGGEMKMAYFHDFGNHIMAGLDLTGAVLSKNRRDIQVSKFNVNPNLILKSNGEIATAEYKNDTYVVNTNGGVIEKEKPLTLSVDADSLKGMQVVDNSTAETYIDVSNGDKDVSFEKGIFNPKLAFVVGGTYKGWFAGLRAGVSYNTGKVKTQEMTETKSVSVASPLVGVQVMKKVSDNTNLYMTADWNVGDLRKSVDINGIKSFKQSSYNISAGVQWKCSFLK